MHRRVYAAKTLSKEDVRNRHLSERSNYRDANRDGGDIQGTTELLARFTLVETSRDDAVQAARRLYRIEQIFHCPL